MTPRDLLTRVSAFLRRYVTFTDPDHATALALWVLGTHLWPHFDAYPYLVITSATKRSGKTRLAELLSFLAANARNCAAMTAATVFRSIREEQPTLFMDEAETLSGENASTMRAVLNVGYRRGQTIPRMEHGKMEEFPVYCPKVFVLIGDVYDTLRDRSIIVALKRAAASMRFVWQHAEAEGHELRNHLATWAEDHAGAVAHRYARHEGAPYLPDRDEEIWLPLLTLAEAMAPEQLTECQRIATDMAVEKTAPKRTYTELEGAEEEADADEYGSRLLYDLLAVLQGHRHLYTVDVLAILASIPTAPWRKFRGRGLTALDMSHLLRRFGVKPTLIRAPGRRDKVQRGYRRVDVEHAAAKYLGER